MKNHKDMPFSIEIIFRFVYQSCSVSVWAHQKDEWKKVITKEGKAREMFEDIIGE